MCCVCVPLLCFYCICVSGGWYSSCNDTWLLFTWHSNDLQLQSRSECQSRKKAQQVNDLGKYSRGPPRIWYTRNRCTRLCVSLHTNLVSSPRAFPRRPKSTSYWISYNFATTNGSTEQTRHLLHHEIAQTVINNFNQGVSAPRIPSLQNDEVGINLKVMQDLSARWLQYTVWLCLPLHRHLNWCAILSSFSLYTTYVHTYIHNTKDFPRTRVKLPWL